MVDPTQYSTHLVDAMAFADRLVAARKQRNLTQQALAERADVHVTQIRRYEAGTSAPTLDALRSLAIALNVTTDSLVFDPDERGSGDTSPSNSKPPATSTPTNKPSSAASSKPASFATTRAAGPPKPAEMSSWRDNASPQAQQDLDGLLDAALGFAQQQLDTHGEFFPYAVAIDTDGQAEMIAARPDPDDEHPKSADVLDACVAALVSQRDYIRAGMPSLLRCAHIFNDPYSDSGGRLPRSSGS